MRLTLSKEQAERVAQALHDKPRFAGVLRRLRPAIIDGADIVKIEDVDPVGVLIVGKEVGGDLGYFMQLQAQAAMGDYD